MKIFSDIKLIHFALGIFLMACSYVSAQSNTSKNTKELLSRKNWMIDGSSKRMLKYH